MRKTQVFLTEDQFVALRRASKHSGRKRSEIIRRGVVLAVEEIEGAAEPDWKAATLAAAGMWKDRDDLDAGRQDMRERYQERSRSCRGAMSVLLDTSVIVDLRRPEAARCTAWTRDPISAS